MTVVEAGVAERRPASTGAGRSTPVADAAPGAAARATLGGCGGDIPAAAQGWRSAVAGVVRPARRPGTLVASAQSGGASVDPAPDAGDDVAALVELWPQRRPVARPHRQHPAGRIGYSISLAIGIVLGVLDRQLPLASRRSSNRRSASCATSRPARSPAVPAVARASTRRPRSRSIVVGTVFYNILMIADVARARARGAGRTPPYTLGAGRLTVLRRVDAAPLVAGHHRRGPHQPGRGVADARRGRAAGRPGGPGLPHRRGRSASASVDRCSPCSSCSALIGAASATSLLRWLRNRTAPWSEGSTVSERSRRATASASSWSPA